MIVKLFVRPLQCFSSAAHTKFFSSSSLFSYLHMISIVLQNLVLLGSPSPASLSRLLSAICSVKQDLLVNGVNTRAPL